MFKTIKISYTKFCGHKHFSSEVRVRFAPSPTGYLHLGGLRTALFNFFFAKSHKGKFILRIEDTDRKRLVPGAVQSLERDLRWVGIVPDEGPTSGGNFGPYLQSDRAELYISEVKKLISSGAAYWCFCSERRLELLRKDAIRNQRVPKYDNCCRHLTQTEIDNKLKTKTEKCVRFILGPSEKFHDTVYGDVFHDVSEIEGDPVILKKDGLPTYHLANVVDDHHMKISHVIRGVEWLQSTPKHIMIYKAFGYEIPQFSHLPLLLNSDGSKLSKRHGDSTVASVRDRGILPSALVSFLVESGSGFPHGFHSTTHTLNELIEAFDMSLVNANPCKVVMDKIPEYNRGEIVKLINGPDKYSLITEVKKCIYDKFSDKYSDTELELKDEYISDVLDWCGPRINVLTDLVGPDMQFLWVKPSLVDLSNDSSGILEKVIPLLCQTEFNKKTLIAVLKEFSKNEGIVFKNLMIVLRSAISGLKEGPGVAEMMALLGRKNSIERLSVALNHLKKLT